MYVCVCARGIFLPFLRSRRLHEASSLSDKAAGTGRAPARQPGAAPARPRADGKLRRARAARSAHPTLGICSRGVGAEPRPLGPWDEHFLTPAAAPQAPNPPLRALARAGVSLRKHPPQGMDPSRSPSAPSTARHFPSPCLSFPTCKPDVRLRLKKRTSLCTGAQPGAAPGSGLSTRRYGQEELWHGQALVFPRPGEHKRLLLLFSPLGASAAGRAPGSGGSKLDQESAALMGSFPMQHTQG